MFCSGSAFAAISVDSKEEMAKQLLNVLHEEKVITSSQDKALQSFKSSANSLLDQKKLVIDINKKYFSYDQFQSISLQAYKKNLTLADMNYLIKVYSDPVMQDYILHKKPLIESDLELLLKRYVKKIKIDMEKDIDVAVEKSLQKKAEAGDVLAQYLLGNHYLSKKTSESNKLAVQWLSKAANSGNILAMNDLAIMYNEGLGVKKDQRTAVQLYQKAAINGDRVAMFNLGLHYFYGAGIEQDYTKALDWFKAAAYRNNMYAQFMLAKSYLIGSGVTRNLKKGKNWLMLVAYQFYDPHFREDDLQNKINYVDTFVTYQMGNLLKAHPNYGKNTTQDMIKKAKMVSKEIDQICSISTFGFGY